MNYTKLIERLNKIPVSVADWKTIEETVAAIDALQSKLGDAIRSLANWQHQCTELQAENERLKDQIDGFVNGQNQLFDAAKVLEAERDALAARLDAMGKGEAVAWSVTVGNDYKNCIEISHCESDVVAQYEESIAGGFESIYTLHKLYAAPKAQAPLKDEPWMVKAIDEAYGIHAKGGQHEDA